jgi:hypothetical protein
LKSAGSSDDEDKVSRATVIAFLLAATAGVLRAFFIDFPLERHPDEPIVAGMAWVAGESGRLTANWAAVPGRKWSRPTYQFSPYTLTENAAALAARRLLGWPATPGDHIRFGRWFSVSCGALAVLVCYFAARTWYGDPWTALLAELLLACSFLHVQDSGYARVEAMLSLAVLLAVWAGGAALASPTCGRCILLGTLIGVAVATKYNAAPLLVMVFAPVLAGRRSAGMAAPARLGRVCVAAIAVPIGFFLATPEALADLDPLVKGIQWEAAHYAHGHPPHEAIDESDGNLKFWADYLARLGFGWATTLAAACFVLTAVGDRRNFLLALFLIAAMTLLVLVRVRFERNAEILLGPACLAAAVFLARAWSVRGVARLAVRTAVVIAVGGTVAQHGVALGRFHLQQQPTSSPFQQLPASLTSGSKRDVYERYIHDPIPDEWTEFSDLLFAGHSDRYSQRGLRRWRERLKEGWRVEVYHAPWSLYGYPFSTVESYHGPGFLLWATRKPSPPDSNGN